MFYRQNSRRARGNSLSNKIGPLGYRAHTLEPLEDRTLLTATHQPPQQFLLNSEGYLTGPSAAAPVQIAENFLRSNAGQLGILASDLNGYLVTTNYVTDTTGATSLTFQQTHNGLPVFNANYNITVSRYGQILSVGGGFVPGLSQRTGTVAPLYGAQQAALSAAMSLDLHDPQYPTLVERTDTYKMMLSSPTISLDQIPTNLHYVPMPGNQVALSWEIRMRTPDGSHWYSASVDASSGELTSLVDYMNNAVYEVQQLPTKNPNEGPRSIATDPHLITPVPATIPSPYGWHDTNGAPGAESTLTIGNNVNAYADRDANDAPDANSQPDGGAGLDFSGALVTFDPNQAPSTYTAASVVNLFYLNNMNHDIHYLYGFNEAARNFQVNNYGRGGLGNDAVNAEAQDGGGVNNANFATPPDGTAPRMQMFEFDVTPTNRDGSFESAIVTHEYGHGVSNRLTGNGVGLFNLQSGGMGEGWSDFWALMFTQKSLADTTINQGQATWVLGQPLTGQGIRDFAYNFNISNQNLETFLNYGIGAGQSVAVHDAGTRWAATLWDLNHLLSERYGYEPNLYNSTSDAGNIKTLHLVMNALKIQQNNPTFIQARDAILAADELLYNGANKLEIWTAFARRGLGELAATSGSNSTEIVTSFEIPASVLANFSIQANSAQLEGNSGITLFTFTVSHTGTIGDTVTVVYQTADNSAQAGSDYVAASGTLTFEAGANGSQTITIAVNGDLEVESNETFFVRLSELSGGIMGNAEGVGTILNDDVDVSVGDIVVYEGNSGIREASVPVTAFGTVNQNIVVSYTLVNGSANAVTDYQPRVGTVMLTPQTPFANVIVPIVGDRMNEGPEELFVVLTGVQGARIADGNGTVTILDEDPLPAMYAGDAQVTTTAAGSYVAIFTVALDVVSGRQVSVSYSTADLTAVAGVDYTSQSGTLVFPSGVTSQQVAIPVTTAGIAGGNKKFTLNLVDPANATLGDPRGDGTIVFAAEPTNEFIIDNGAAAYTRSNNAWTTLTNTLAYQLDYDYAAAGNGSATATWNFTAIPNGSYEVFARWSAFGNRATNAPYTILDNQTPRGTVAVNQQLAPTGEYSNGVTWQSLGFFDITTNTLRVRLGNNANGYVTADAIRIVGGGIPAQTAEIDVAGLDHSISTGDISPAAEDGTDFGSVPSLGVSVVRTFTITNNGNADLHLSGNPLVTIGGPHASDFTLTKLPAPVVAPGAKTTFQLTFRATDLGTRSATVTIANSDDSEHPYQFVVQGSLSNAGPLLAHNADLPQDVTNDGRVNASDALVIVNRLLSGPEAQPLAATAGWNGSPTYYFDVTADGRVNSSDLLSVINHLLLSQSGPTAAPQAAEPLTAQALAAQVVDEALVLFDAGDDELADDGVRIELAAPVAAAASRSTAGSATLLEADEAVELLVAEDDDELDGEPGLI